MTTRKVGPSGIPAGRLQVVRRGLVPLGIGFGWLGRLVGVGRRRVPLAVEMLGLGLIAWALSYVHEAAAIGVVGVWLLLAGNQAEG